MRGSAIWLFKFIVVAILLLLALKWWSLLVASPLTSEEMRQTKWLIAIGASSGCAAVLLITRRNIVRVMFGVPIILACIAVGFVADCVLANSNTEPSMTWGLPPLVGTLCGVIVGNILVIVGWILAKGLYRRAFTPSNAKPYSAKFL